jgi:hypothetical protein
MPEDTCRVCGDRFGIWIGPPMAFPEPLPDMRILDPRQTTLICEAQP